MKRIRTVFLAVSATSLLLVAALAVADRPVQEELFRAMGNLAEVVHLVRTEYVDELDASALEASLDAGILESIDPWAAVLPAELADRADEVLGAPPPYGLLLGLRLSSAAVRHTVSGSPARAAGLEPGEVVEQVEGVYTRGRPLWHISQDLREREAKGESVRLTVVDRLVDARREVMLESAPWEPPPPTVEDFGTVRVITLAHLAPGTAERLTNLLDGVPAAVLDLRETAWGVEDEAVRVADLFADQGVLAQWRGRRAGERTYSASSPVVSKTRLVVVVGAGTEGAGEILGAALSRLGVPLVGGRTAGHAPHMRLVHDGGLHLWIPVAHWLRGDGDAITGNGLEPDQEAEDEAALELAVALLTAADERAA